MKLWQMLTKGAVAVVMTMGTAGGVSATTLSGGPPLVIGHRGASGYLPEHTIEAYRLAIAQGADFIEPDLVSTRDGVLIARHEPMLSGTTDVASRSEFTNRKTTKQVDGRAVTDWFAGDFTLAEIRTLRARQAFGDRDQTHNDRYAIPTLDEVIDLAKAESARTGRTIGIYPETKHPTFHAENGLALEDKLLETLQKAGWSGKTAPVIIQSFETANLKYLRNRTEIRLVQLIGANGVDRDGKIVLRPPFDRPYDFVRSGDRRIYTDLVTSEGLAEIKTYVDGIGVWKNYVISSRQRDADNDGRPDDLNADGTIDERDRLLLPASDLVKNAHEHGLFVHVWTLRAEKRRLAADFDGDPVAEHRAFIDAGVDGLFSDHPDVAEKARGAR